MLQTELRTLLELFACHALGAMIRSKALQTIKPEEKGDTINMCKAINDLMQDSRVEGEAVGRMEGEAFGSIKGEERMVQLAQKLLDAGQLSVFVKALKDAELRNQLSQQYQLL